MAGRTNKQSPASKQTSSTTRRRVTRRPESKPAKGSKPHPRSMPAKTGNLHTSGTRRTIPPATRGIHRVTSTNKKSATFSLAAPTGVDVAVAGSFNNWEPQAMTRGRDGVWRITLQLAPGNHQYKFLVGTQWREDPNNPRKVQNDQGGFNSVCSVM